MSLHAFPQIKTKEWYLREVDMYYLIIDEKKTADINIMVRKRPDIPAPSRKYNVYDLKGRDGSGYETLDLFDDIEISVECNYITEPNNWHEQWRKVKSFFLHDAYELSFSDDRDHFRKIKMIKLGTSERSFIETGTFEVSFVVAPYEYLFSGKKEIEGTSITNLYDKSLPVYKIVGEGMCDFTVNGNMISVNVGQELIIDTDKKISYKKDLSFQLIDNIDFDKFVLNTGVNTLSVSDGFLLRIIPNWRSL